MIIKKIKDFDIILLVVSTIIITSYIATFNQSPNFFFGSIKINEINGNVLGILSITFTIVIGLLFFLLQNKTDAKIQKSIETSNNIVIDINKIVKNSEQLVNEIHLYNNKRELIELDKKSVILKRFLDIQAKLVLNFENFKNGLSNFNQNNFNQSRSNSKVNMTNFLSEYSYIFEITMSITIILADRNYLLENLGLTESPSFITEIEDKCSSFLGGLHFLQMQLDNLSYSSLDLQKIRWNISMIENYKNDFDLAISTLEQKLKETNSRICILKANEEKTTVT